MTDLNNNLQNKENTQGTINQGVPPVDAFEPGDIEKNKTMAGLAYLIFFLPLIACPESKYAKFHANQALLLFLAAIVGNIILGMIPVIGWILMPVYALGMLAMGIMGLINGFGGKTKRLPLFGKYTILK